MPAHLVDLLDVDPVTGNFFPTVYINDFWLLKDYLKPINDTTPVLELDLFLAPISAWWWNLYVQMDQSFKMQASMGSMGEGEADEIKVRTNHAGRGAQAARQGESLCRPSGRKKTWGGVENRVDWIRRRGILVDVRRGQWECLPGKLWARLVGQCESMSQARERA